MIYFISGLMLGTAAAVQPGPFQAFLFGRTLAAGWRQASPAAFAPLLSDGPIIVLMVLLLSHTPGNMLSLLRLFGGLFLLYLAYHSWEMGPDVPSSSLSGGKTLLHGALMNLLNPNPYIFWASVAGPLLISGWRESPIQGISFLLGFYGTLIGGFIILVRIFSLLGRPSGKAKMLMSRISAAILGGFGVYLLTQGIVTLVC